jgi:hypothetical protein
MKKHLTSVASGAAAVTLLLALGASPASAYGAGSWTVQPYGCDPGSFSGSSYWQAANYIAHAETYESGNFCWFGNTQVAVAIHDEYSQVRAGYVNASTWVSVNYNTGYNSGWGGFHSWGTSSAYRT